MEHDATIRRTSYAAVAVLAACVLAAPAVAGAPASTTEAEPLPEGVEARELPEGTEAQELPDGEPAQALPGDPGADTTAVRAGAVPPPLHRPVPPGAGDDPAFWERRRERAEASLVRVRATLHETEERFTRACREAGGERCHDLRAAARDLRRQEDALERYLDEGLRRECRRAGCQPGWIRDS